jgi:hypothetical protein
MERARHACNGPNVAAMFAHRATKNSLFIAKLKLKLKLKYKEYVDIIRTSKALKLALYSLQDLAIKLKLKTSLLY